MAYTDTSRNGFNDCTGCKLCALPCPVFRRSQDLMLTMAGRMKAMQRGASPVDLTHTLDACLLCGACDAVCPENIDTIGILMDARRNSAYLKQSQLAAAAKDAGPTARVEAGLDEGFEKKVYGSAKKTLQSPATRNLLGEGDLLILESRAYHSEFTANAAFFHKLREETGCTINLDLQRAAVPTGSASLQASLGMDGLKLEEQAAWVFEGYDLKRIIVEDPLDQAPLEKASGLPVLLLSELAS